jgi:hypothetical protein
LDSSTLTANLPKYYVDSAIVKMIANAIATELTTADTSLASTLNQFFVNTADTSLSDWESEFDITTDTSKTDDERRSAIKAKIQSNATTTKAQLIKVISNWTGGTVEITESPSTYSIVVKFVDTIGIPSQIEDVYSAVAEIIPAHLGVTYEFMYNTWEYISGFTWLDLKEYTWEEIETGTIEKSIVTLMYSQSENGTYNVMKFE